MSETVNRISNSMLPARGSQHVGFIEMGFRWGGLFFQDMYRWVTMPDGWRVFSDTYGEWSIVDAAGNVRAKAIVPDKNVGLPSIVPIKRYSIDCNKINELFVGLAMDRGDVVYRTKPQQDQKLAILMVKKWLTENKAGWESYTSEINFK